MSCLVILGASVFSDIVWKQKQTNSSENPTHVIAVGVNKNTAVSVYSMLTCTVPLRLQPSDRPGLWNLFWINVHVINACMYVNFVVFHPRRVCFSLSFSFLSVSASSLFTA